MAEDSQWFSKFDVLEILLAKDVSNRTLLDRIKRQPKLHEAVANEVSFQSYLH